MNIGLIIDGEVHHGGGRYTKCKQSLCDNEIFVQYNVYGGGARKYCDDCADYRAKESRRKIYLKKLRKEAMKRAIERGLREG